MTVRFYTIGYAGRTADDLEAILKREDGALLDIRISPRSRKPGFNKSQLEKRFGEDYLWVVEFGNNSSDGGIELADPDFGLDLIKSIYDDSVEDNWNGAVFLMCACADPSTCHRTTVAALLREHGYEVTEYPG